MGRLLALLIAPLVVLVAVALLMVSWIVIVPFVAYKLMRGERDMRAMFAAISPQSPCKNAAGRRKKEAESDVIEGEFIRIETQDDTSSLR